MQSAAALVGSNGSVDWLCLPRFDSPSCFAALLGDERHGRRILAPVGEVRASSRRYRPGTLILETDFETAEGAARVIDFMPRRGDGPPRLMRIVEGLRGRVPMRMELSPPRLRCDRPVGRACAGRHRRNGRPGRVPPQHGGSARGRGRICTGRVRRRRGRPRTADPHPAPLLRGGAVRRRRRVGARSDRGMVAGVGRSLHVSGAVSRSRAHVLARTEGDDLRADRRPRRRPDDLPARGHRRHPELGLSLLLVARLGSRARGSPRDRLHEEALAFRDYLVRVGTGNPGRFRSCTESPGSGA